MRLLRCLAVGLALLASSSALADNARLEAAKRLYQRAELDAALAELKAAEDSSKDDNDLVQILIYKGLIFADTGQGQQSQEMFKRALAMRPWAEVPNDISPRIAKQFHEARKEVWGSPGIKPWPKRKDGSVYKPPEQPSTPPPAAVQPAQPAPTTPPAATPAAPVEQPKPEDKPAAAPTDQPTAPPADAAPAQTPQNSTDAPTDAPPDVPPTK